MLPALQIPFQSVMGDFCVQPWMTADEIAEATQTAIATNFGPDGQPATLQSIYLRHIREVRPALLQMMRLVHQLFMHRVQFVSQQCFTLCPTTLVMEDPLVADCAGAGSVSTPYSWRKAGKPGAALP